ncbi:hypothetical protein C8Q80DRAFT_505264 [Daedaleopsis nitida]|nr:hypothetical protein C8Q80DRAFT_505264 [Daedaleopsis nitida]
MLSTHAVQDSTHIVEDFLSMVDTTSIAPASSPPSSSPVAITPPDCLEHEHAAGRPSSHQNERIHQALDSDPPSPFLQKLEHLLRAVQGTSRTSSGCALPSNSARSRVSVASASNAAAISHYTNQPARFQKKRKLSARPRRVSNSASHTTNGTTVRLSGAFKLQYARGPGSLRRAESLRTEFSAADEEEVLNEDSSDSTNASRPQRLPVIVGSIASHFGGYAPTVPTTPTANDVQAEASPKSASEPQLDRIPIIAPPTFESIPRAPLSHEDTADRRLLVLLAREREERDADGLSSAPVLDQADPANQHGQKDEDNEDENGSSDNGDSEYLATLDDLHAGTVNSPQLRRRATLSSHSVELDIEERLLEQAIQWLTEVAQPLCLIQLCHD